MGTIHLVIGPVGAGKSTYGMQLSQQHQAVRLTLDAWMTVLFGEDERPAEGRLQWYMARTARCFEQIWELTTRLIELDTDVILEIGLIQAAARRDFYLKAEALDCPLRVYVVDAPRDIRRERTMKRNADKGATYSMDVPLQFFELASDHWEPPDDEEFAERKMVRVNEGSA